MNYYEKALQLREETVAHRRRIHANAEVGLELPMTRQYVLEALREAGLEPSLCGMGVTATVGAGERCVLLRADMDALPMTEESGESFASTNGAAHACGHDLHAAMLLTAAKLLKQNEAALPGRVKFMFQPGEETFEGAKNMVENGVLEDPPVDAAIAFHVTTGKLPVGLYMYNSSGTLMASVDGFRIEVTGKGAHGAMPHRSVDPINIAVHIYLALEALMAREADPKKMSVLTVGSFHAGTAANIIPETAVLEGTLRTDHRASRELLVRRLREVAEKTAQVYGGEARVVMTSGVPPLVCDGRQTEAVAAWLRELGAPGTRGYSGVTASASEDFAVIAEAVPSTFMHLGAGFGDSRGDFPAHNPKVRFNEDVLPFGAAAYAHCAHRWLEAHR